MKDNLFSTKNKPTNKQKPWKIPMQKMFKGIEKKILMHTLYVHKKFNITDKKINEKIN